MKVLLLAYFYPPDPAVGGLRARNVAESLRAAGHEVRVVAGPLPTGARADGDPRTRRIDVRLDARALYASLKRRLRGSADRDGATGPADLEWRPAEKQSGLRRLVSALLWLPDDRQGWVPPVVWYALRNRDFDMVYTSAPPFSTHLAGLLIRHLLGVRWAAEFRDPWTGNPWKPEHVRSPFTDRVDAWLERRCLKSADHVIAVTEAAADGFRQRLRPAGRAKVVVVRNGIERLEPVAEAPLDGARGPILYVGNLYHSRDPRPFFLALAALRRQGGLPDDVRVRFVGDCSTYANVDLRAFVDEAGLGDMVCFLPNVPHAECMAMIRNAGLLLLFAQDQPAQVPNKLYEYLGSRRPILAFVDGEGESAALLRRIGGHHMIERNEVDAIRPRLAEALSSSGRGAIRPDDGLLGELSTEAQMRSLTRLLEEV